MIGEGVSTAQRSDSLVQLINQHFLNHIVELINMSFSEFDVTRRTCKGNFLNQIDYLIEESGTVDSVMSQLETWLTRICT